MISDFVLIYFNVDLIEWPEEEAFEAVADREEEVDVADEADEAEEVEEEAELPVDLVQIVNLME